MAYLHFLVCCHPYLGVNAHLLNHSFDSRRVFELIAVIHIILARRSSLWGGLGMVWATPVHEQYQSPLRCSWTGQTILDWPIYGMHPLVVMGRLLMELNGYQQTLHGPRLARIWGCPAPHWGRAGATNNNNNISIVIQNWKYMPINCIESDFCEIMLALLWEAVS